MSEGRGSRATMCVECMRCSIYRAMEGTQELPALNPEPMYSGSLMRSEPSESHE